MTLQEMPSEFDSVEAKTLAWNAWVARETQLRTLLGLHIIHGVAAHFSGNHAASWLTASSLPLPADEEIFNADTPDKWIREMSRSRRETMSFGDVCRSLFPSDGSPQALDSNHGLFEVKVLLEILSCLAVESKKMDSRPVGIPPQPKVVEALRMTRHEILTSKRLTPTHRSISLLRWHAVCLDFLSSVARGARRMCYQYNITQNIFGGEKRVESEINPHGWVESKVARKCLLHALEIEQIAAQIPLGVAHDVYLAGAIFAAATTFTSFTLTGVSKVLVPASVNWDAVLGCLPEQPSSGNMAASNAAACVTTSFLEHGLHHLKNDCETHNLVYDLSSLRIFLRSLSLQWGVAKEMEEVVEAWTLRCG